MANQRSLCNANISTPMLSPEHRNQAVSLDIDQYEDAKNNHNCIQKIFVVLRPEWFKNAKEHFTLQEFSGSLGDLGTFLPLVTALAVKRIDGVPQISFGPVLFFAGIYSLLISSYFEIPIPIQPMKTITSASLLNGNSHLQIAASGIAMGVIMLVLTAMGGIHILAKYTPPSLVRGIQMGIGLGLMTKGLSSNYAYVHERQFTVGKAGATMTKNVVWFGGDSVFAAALMGLFCLVFMNSKRVPTALVIFLYGVIVSICKYYSIHDKYSLRNLSIGPAWDGILVPSMHDFSVAMIDLVLPQLPLTILNSVVAVAALSKDLFPTKAISNPRAAISVGVGNLAFCWFGMLPSCHGAGGLASQYAFGARSNVSMIFLGFLKIFIALLFGSSSIVLLQDGIFPASVLGVLLVFSGLSLCLVAIEVQSKNDAIIMLITAATTLTLDTGVAFIFGVAATIILRLLENYDFAILR